METARARDALLDPRVLAVPLFAYGCARAALLAITHDEALTYLLHVSAPWRAVIAHAAPLASNNHLLNTLAVKALCTVLPPTELVLRLPALAGLALFLWAAQRLLRAVTTGMRRPLGFLLLAANPFVLDLLIVCRGYALALGLSLAALALLLDDRLPRGPAAAMLPAIAAALAVVANLAFLYAFVALATAATWLAGARAAGTGVRERLRRAALAAGPFAVAGLLLAAVYPPHVVARIHRVVAAWGGDRGVWRDTVATLADGTLYGAPWLVPAHFTWVAALTAAAAAALLAGAVVALLASRRRVHRTDPLLRAMAACVLAIVAWMAQVIAAHVLASAPYPIERAASVLAPLLTLVFVLLWEVAASSPAWRRVAPLGTLAGCVLLLHFAACVNLDHTYLWRLDADSRAAARIVAGAAAGAPAESLRLGVSWQLEPAANFYRITRGISGLAPVTRADLHTGFDLYLLAPDDAAMEASLGLHRCATFPVSGTVLAAPLGLPCPRRAGDQP